MTHPPFKTHYPESIHLEKNTLVEAWLEIRWQLEEGDEPQFRRDPGFDLALGVFYQHIRSRFPTRIDLVASNIPPVVAPHIVRYQFRDGPDGWPLLQLGPGVASVNYTTPYTWDDFKETALFLREQLTESYEQELKTAALILRYRNAFPFDYNSNNLLEFLERNLNISLKKPESIPGDAGKSEAPSALNFGITFDLQEEVGQGTIKIGTGKRREADTSGTEQEFEAIIFEVEVRSNPDQSPSLYIVEEFDHWLTLAHLVIHDWYFSLIEGPIREQLEGN